MDISEVESAPLAHVATRLVLAEEAVLAVGPDAVDTIDPATLVVVSTLARGALDAAWHGERAWLCDADGVWRVEVDEPVQVLADPCAAIGPLDDGLVVAGSALTRWRDDGAGGLTDAETLAEGGFDRVATYGSDVAGSGGTTVVVATDAGVETFDAGGDVRGLAWDGVAVWSVRGTVRDATGSSVAVAADPGALAPADVDADGSPELLVLHPDSIGVLREGSERTFTTEAWDDALLVVPDDAGDAIWALGDDGTTLRVARDLGDGDDDGWTTEEGDCDDGDPDFWPGAPEECDGRDLDCDGTIHWDAGDWLPDLAVLEGHTVTYTFPDECFGRVITEFTYEDVARATCVSTWQDLRCEGHQDGVVDLSAEVRAGDGTILDTRDGQLTIVNVAPDIGPCVDEWGFDRFESRIEVGDLVECTFSTADIPYDAITVAATGGPPGLEVGEDGSVLWDVRGRDAGTWEVEITASDSDGGTSSRTLTVDVARNDFGCCCLFGALVLFVPSGVLRAAARRGASSACRVSSRTMPASTSRTSGSVARSRRRS